MNKNYFSKPGDLSDNYFKKAGDIQNTKRNDFSNKNKIEKYLLSIVSGKKYRTVCELGTLVEGGNTIVDIETLQKMVESGVNIISAKYINDKMIMIEFQVFRQADTKGRRK